MALKTLRKIFLKKLRLNGSDDISNVYLLDHIVYSKRGEDIWLILSQSEIDSLLSALSSGEIDASGY